MHYISRQVEIVKEYVGERDALGRTETFFLALSDLDRLTARIDALAHTHTFGAQAGSLLDEINGVIATCAQVRASASLRACLQLVLALGNYLNGTSYRGGAYGFKLADLAKLEQVGARHARDMREMYPRYTRDGISASPSARAGAPRDHFLR